MLFSRNKPIVFDRYRSRRKGIGLPRWLWLLIGGAALGAAGVIYVEQRVLPPRLSAAESAALRQDFAHADEERTRLQTEAAALRQQLEAATAGARQRDEEIAAAKKTAEQLRGDLETLVDTLPPDPRGGDVEVRAARFTANAGKLDYDLVLTRRRGPAKPINGVMQIVVAGASGGRNTTVTLKPVALQVGRHEIVRGSVALPEDFTPRQTTVTVLDRVAGRALGMRVLLVDNA